SEPRRAGAGGVLHADVPVAVCRRRGARLFELPALEIPALDLICITTKKETGHDRGHRSHHRDTAHRTAVGAAATARVARDLGARRRRGRTPIAASGAE